MGNTYCLLGSLIQSLLPTRNYKKEDDKQTSCQSSLSTDRLSPCFPSSSLVQLCFRTKIAEYLRKKRLLLWIDHSAPSIFISPHFCPCISGSKGKGEDRVGFAVLFAGGMRLGCRIAPLSSCHLIFLWISSLDQRRKPGTRKQDLGFDRRGYWRSAVAGSHKSHSQNLQCGEFEHWPEKSERILAHPLWKGHLCPHLILIPGIWHCWHVSSIQCDPVRNKFRS